MGKPVPNWKLIDCPKCGKLAGQNCHVEEITDLCCPERARLAGIGRKDLNQELARTFFHPGRNPTHACGEKHEHSRCKGRHQGNHGLPGLPCTCTCHRTRKKS